MNRGIILVIGFVLTFGSSWVGLVYLPYTQLPRLEPYSNELSNEVYPKPLEGSAADGRKIYIANGCIYCHTQQVRNAEFGPDIARGWGTRRTVARDYIYDTPIQLGTMRTGPDLANVGQRWSADWQHKHLYNPRMMTPGSIMPSFAFLYEKRPVDESTPDALILPGPWAEPGFVIVPKPEAKALVDYLLSLNHSFDLPEARE